MSLRSLNKQSNNLKQSMLSADYMPALTVLCHLILITALGNRGYSFSNCRDNSNKEALTNLAWSPSPKTNNNFQKLLTFIVHILLVFCMSCSM